MRLTPLSIRQQEFSRSFRGLDENEVITFLERAADDFEELVKENEALKKKVEKSEEQLSEFRKIEKNLQDTLLKTTEASSKAMESTKKQTALITKEAELKAEQIIDDAKEQEKKLREAVIKLTEEKDLVLSKLKAIIATQAELLKMDIKFEEPAKKPAEKEEETKKDKDDINYNKIIEKLL